MIMMIIVMIMTTKMIMIMIMTMLCKAIAGPDLEHMRTEPRLFPGKADDHLLAQVKCH